MNMTLNTNTYGDVLKFLEIENVFFDFQTGKTAALQIEKIDNKKWIVFSSDLLIPMGIINIQTNMQEYRLKCFTKPITNDIGEYEIELYDSLPQTLSLKIEEYNNLVNSSERRKEERYDVGLTKWQEFKLQTPDQRLYYNKTNAIKCLINNVSVHGCLVTGESSKLKISQDIVKMAIRFNDPGEIILQSAVICRIVQKTPQLFRYSLNFIEPLALSWQKRIEDYVIGLKI